MRTAARRKDPSLLAPFEKTVLYHGQIALRAAKTRRKKAQQAQAQSEAEQETEEPSTPPG